ncbi:methyltransferase [Streptomyces sp. NPDC059009]|uniref:methyltransferase n=1 Tax=Streptomyces sp. NPDC059009 TaxID=3346694 RepID=UPI0036934558
MDADERQAALARQSGARLIEEALGYVVPAALRAVTLCGIADHLGEGPRTAEELALASGTDAGNLHRMLRLLATRGLFSEDEEGRFRLTETGYALRSDVPGSVRGAVLMNTDPAFWLPLGQLERCLRDGTSAFEGIFGRPFFEHFAQDPQTAAVFHDGMAAKSAVEDQPIAEASDLPDRGTVVDIGGGHGGYLAEALRLAPGLTGVLYDEAHVLDGHVLADDARIAGRWRTAEGDFFAEVPAGDVLVLKRILHDWRDDQCVTVLRACRRALSDGGRVLVIDAVIEPGDKPHPAKVLDLLMMASLEGRERTEEEFRALFAQAGLRLRRVLPTGTALSVVEAVAAR